MAVWDMEDILSCLKGRCVEETGYNIISPWGWTNGVRFRLAKIGTDKKTLETISEVFYETYSTGLIEKEYSAHHDIFLAKGEKLVLLCKVQSGREPVSYTHLAFSQ